MRWLAFFSVAGVSVAASCSSYSSRFGKELAGVCVCNATQCDEIPSEYQSLGAGDVGVFVTSLAGDRLNYTALKSEPAAASEATIVLDTSVTYQKILGFGGAFTDASSINTYKLLPEVQDKFIEAYFGKNGLQYSLGRVPIGSTDFSESIYSYNPVEGDLEMKHFSIDVDKSNATHKLEFIQRVLKASSRKLPLFASSWAPPAWVTRENSTTNSHIIGEPGDPYWKATALYYSRFFDEYKKEGITFFAITPQNEPDKPALSLLSWQQLRFNSTQERDFIKKDLGPLLKKNHPELTIIMMDDQKDLLNQWAPPTLDDPDAKQYVTGVGVHWYKNIDFIADGLGNFKDLADFHAKYPDIFILPTEACEGSMPDGVGTGRGTKLNDTAIMWRRAENYARDIINDLANFAVGWTDWNLILDTDGGPNWVGNVVDAPIIADEKGGVEFYKQPMYYVLGHVAKFLPPNSTRVSLDVASSAADSVTWKTVDRVAFLTPEQQLVLVLQNRGNASLNVTVRDAQGQRDVRTSVPARAVQTLIFGARESPAAAPGASSEARSPRSISFVGLVLGGAAMWSVL